MHYMLILEFWLNGFWMFEFIRRSRQHLCVDQVRNRIGMNVLQVLGCYS